MTAFTNWLLSLALYVIMVLGIAYADVPNWFKALVVMLGFIVMFFAAMVSENKHREDSAS